MSPILAKFNFPKAARICRRQEFLQLQDRGKKLYSRGFIVIVSAPTGTSSRIGITVSKKVSARAVIRNQIKRRIREIFRTHLPYFTAPIDLVIIARNSATESSYYDMKRQILGTLRSHGYINATERNET